MVLSKLKDWSSRNFYHPSNYLCSWIPINDRLYLSISSYKLSAYYELSIYFINYWFLSSSTQWSYTDCNFKLICSNSDTISFTFISLSLQSLHHQLTSDSNATQASDTNLISFSASDTYSFNISRHTPLNISL